ncbi:MAG: DUF2892 domain-containing protein [Rhodobacterales bacterium]
MNVGKFDRVLRIIIGLVLIIAPFATNISLFSSAAMTYGAVIVGVVLLATAIFRFCPLYRILGIRTCKM